MKTADFKVVIPARYASSRFPGKPLAPIAGRPMIEHVCLRARESNASEIVLATDDERIGRLAGSLGIKVHMTDPDCPSGTDRIAQVSAAEAWPDDTVIVNLQGDEPLTPPAVINQVAHNLQDYQAAGIATLCSPIESSDDFINPNVVKVVFDNRGQALYFSRAPIPWPRESNTQKPQSAFRHIGIYAYRAGFLRHWSSMQESSLEHLEKLEQLRAMQEGVIIHVAEACQVPPHGVDTPQQLKDIEKLMKP